MLCSMEHVPCIAACSMLCSISNALQHVYCFAACIMLCSMFTVPCGILTLQHIRIKNSFDPLVTGLSFKRCVCALCVSSALTHTHTHFAAMLCSKLMCALQHCAHLLCSRSLWMPASQQAKALQQHASHCFAAVLCFAAHHWT